MRRKASRLITPIVVSALSILMVSIAGAQEFPSKPVRMIVGFAPGGTTDRNARMLALKLSPRLRQPVVVENQPGAGSLVATNYVRAQPPDGYTLLISSITIVTLPSLNRAAAYDPIRDFTPVAGMPGGTQLVTVRADFPAKNLTEFIAYAKANPRRINAGAAGSGSFDQLVGQMFASRAGIELNSVPYRGDAAMVLDVLAGRIDVIFLQWGSVAQHNAAGKLRTLAVIGQNRLGFIPDIPTTGEFGISGAGAEFWGGAFGPAEIPRAIVDRLNREINESMREPEAVEMLKTGFQQMPTWTPDQLGAAVKRDYEEFRRLIQQSGIKAE